MKQQRISTRKSATIARKLARVAKFYARTGHIRRAYTRGTRGVK